MIKTIPDSTNAIGDCALRMTVATGLMPHRNHFIARTSIVALVFFLHLLDGGAGRICFPKNAIDNGNRGKINN